MDALQKLDLCLWVERNLLPCQEGGKNHSPFKNDIIIEINYLNRKMSFINIFKKIISSIIIQYFDDCNFLKSLKIHINLLAVESSGENRNLSLLLNLRIKKLNFKVKGRRMMGKTQQQIIMHSLWSYNCALL